MEQWRDQAIVLSVKPHGENGGILSLLTEGHGRYTGYVRGVHSSKMRGALEAGNIVDVEWITRVDGNLGTFSIELRKNSAAMFMNDPLRLAALQSGCALCDAALPEREGHAGLFYGLAALMDALGTDIWGESYVMWEIAFLRELGFSLDLKKCAGGGDDKDLMYVSPKTGRAVSREKGEGFKDRLLLLPTFLRPISLSLTAAPSFPLPVGRGIKGEGENSDFKDDILLGLKLTAHFLEHWVFVHNISGMPGARARLQDRVSKWREGPL
jgi:DNA repair protein RecO (recombination protein O)